jgi:hypothetical protein
MTVPGGRMPRIRSLIPVFLLAFSAASASAQNSQTILPYDSPVIQLLHSILLEQGKEPLSTAGPFSIGELRMMLDKVDPSTLSEAGKRAYQAVTDALATRPAEKPMALKFAAHPQASVEGYFHTNTDAATTEWQEGYNERLPLAAIPMDIWMGDHAYADFDLALRQNHDALDAALVPGNYCNWTLDFDLFDIEIPQRAFVAVGGESWSFTIGRDRFSWGNGETGDLLVSDDSDYWDFARLTLYWPRIKYSGLWIMLTSYGDESYGTTSQSADGDDDGDDRNYMLHRLDFEIWDNLSISVSEGILVGGTDIDLSYFNPLIIFHDFYRWGYASSISALDVCWNPWRYFEVYGQAAYNQIQTLYEIIRYGSSASDVPGAAAYLGGVRARVPEWQGYVDAGAEAAIVEPWMYLRESLSTSYEQWRYEFSNVSGSPQWVASSIGYFTGPDAVVYSVWVSYDVPDLFMVGLDFKHIAKGEQDYETAFAEDAAAAALVSPTGIVEYTDVVHLRGSVDPLPFLRLAADLYWVSMENYWHASGVQVDDFQASVSVTVHADL